jgi:hypothetical protein
MFHFQNYYFRHLVRHFFHSPAQATAQPQQRPLPKQHGGQLWPPLAASANVFGGAGAVTIQGPSNHTATVPSVKQNHGIRKIGFIFKVQSKTSVIKNESE